MDHAGRESWPEPHSARARLPYRSPKLRGPGANTPTSPNCQDQQTKRPCGNGLFGLAQSCPVAILALFPGGSGGGEMTFRAIYVALLLSILPTTGCGTAANLVRSRPEEGGKSPFGGVRQDMWCIRKAANGEFGFQPHLKSEPEQYPQVALMLFCAADLPFSLLGDIVTWPYTVSYSFINQPIPIPPMAFAPPPGTQPMPVPPGTQPMPLPPPSGTQPMLLPVPPTTQRIPIPTLPATQPTAVSQPKTAP
jgi:hypothetical protein